MLHGCGVITAENAREFAARGNKIRWEAWKSQKLAEQQAKESPAIESPVADDSFRIAMTKRVRDQIETLQKKLDDQLIAEKLDTKALRDITDAISKLENVEQRLSNRPLPGSLRPKQERTKRSSSTSPEPESA